MEILRSFYSVLSPFVGLIVTIAIFGGALFVTQRMMMRQQHSRNTHSYRRQIVMLALTILGLLMVIISSPLSDTQKGQLLSLVGLLLSAAIALSSTTFLGNAMAGVMLRAVQSFRTGDYVRVGDYFGRVSDRGLFHTEIQTEDRDLMTLPNLFLVTNPVKVIRESGSIVTADLSLGYDVPRKKVEGSLIEAAQAADLTDPFVHVIELGDFSVTYRIGGLLREVKHVVSARSRLKEMILDTLHGHDIEILSPSFMSTRAFPENRRFIPRVTAADRGPDPPEEKNTAEEIAFDKAEDAMSIEMLETEGEELSEKVKEAEEELKEAKSDEEKDRLTRRIERLNAMKERTATLAEELRSESE